MSDAEPVTLEQLGRMLTRLVDDIAELKALSLTQTAILERIAAALEACAKGDNSHSTAPHERG